MPEPLLEKLSDLLEAELKSRQLERIPKSIYREVAAHVKGLRNGANTGERNVLSLVAAKERDLTFKLAQRLLQVRVEKAAASVDEINGGSLTLEEKYLLEPMALSEKRRQKIYEALRQGQASVLESVSQRMASRYTLVRFLQASLPIVGTDLSRHGPFEKEDIAILPAENAKPLIRQGVATEVWVED